MKRLLTCGIALLLAVVMVLGMASCTTPGETPTEPATDPATEPSTREVVVFKGDYTYKDSVSKLASNWNPHTYQTSDDAYPAEFIRTGLYGLYFNDELHPVEGKEPFGGYVVMPEMAAEMPIDVTEEVKASHPNFNIPESATKGYAYKIKLNPDAKWEDGTPINADTYIYSMKELLNPQLLNYRASDYYASDLCIAGAENYANQGRSYWDFTALGMTAEAFLAQGHTVDEIIVDMSSFWGVNAADGTKYALATDDTMVRDTAVAEDDPEAYVSAKYLYDNYLGPNGPYAAYGAQYLGSGPRKSYPETFNFEDVGCYKTGDYEIVLVFGKSLAGFNLYYNLTSNWIVNEALYEAGKKQVGDSWVSTYNTDVASTLSYGPYKLVSFQSDKSMRFEKNENWFGYTDGKHTYVDPSDNKIYPMYQTTVIDCQVVEEADTRKMMFLNGELMGYGLQAADFDQYRSSEYCHATPSETIFFLILNGHIEAINSREANESFDTSKYDIQCMSLKSFKKAMSVVYDKDLFAATISPSRSGAFGVIGSSYVYDVDTGALYRDTDQAKKALCSFYGVDPADFGGDLTKAVDSITGYDPEKAKVYFKEAFDEAIKAGYITDADNDGKSDQTVRIEYALSADSDFMTKTINYLNEKVNEVTVGTPFEGKIEFYKSAIYGNDWSDKIKQGQSDTALAGWQGSVLNPFSLTDLYCNPSKSYSAKWFDANNVNVTININGKDVTLTLYQWSDALNGATVKDADGVEYCFGDGIADIDTRLDILAKFEETILTTYDYIPLLQDGSMSLLSMQVYYVVEEYNPIIGRGGIAYLKYNYNDADWTAFVASQGGTLAY